MLPAGTVLGQRYRIVRQMARGGMSNIYLCEDQRLTGKKWVVKELDAQYQDPKERENAKTHFEREASLLANLEHRNLPKVIDYFNENGKNYLVMEFVDGEDLSRILSKSPGPLPEKQVADWGIQIATVLYFLHCRKPEPIIFRDLKPSNIILSGNIVKLIDFGIARHFSPTKKGDTMRIGSPGYAPPEQYSGQTDPRSDIYSLGVTLYQLMTKFDPANTQTPFKFPPISSINPAASPRLIQIIEKMIQMEPEKRYQAAIEVKRDLQVMIGADITSPNMFGGQKTIPSIVMPQGQSPQPQLSGATIPSAGFTPAAGQQGGLPPQADGSGSPPPPQQQKGAGAGKKKIAALKPAGKTPPLRRVALIVLLLCMAAGVYFAWKSSLLEPVFELLQGISITSGRDTGYNADLPEDQLVRRGIENINSGNLKKAFSNLDTVREKYRDDGEVLLYLNNAYILGSGAERICIGFETSANGSRANQSERERYRGAALAQSVINKYGGIPLSRNIKVELIPRITKNESGRINRVTKELLQMTELIALLGAFPQGSEGKVAEAAEKSECSVISLGGPQLPVKAPVILSISPPEKSEYTAMGKLASDTIKPATAALLFRKDSCADERRAFSEKTGKDIKIVEYPFENDGAAAVTQLKGSPPALIVLISTLSTEEDIKGVQSVLDAMRKDKVTMPVLVNPAVWHYMTEKAPDPPSQILFTVVPSSESKQDPAILGFYREYVKVYSRYPAGPEGITAYDGVILTATAVEKGGEPSRAAVLSFLKELGAGGTFEGAGATMTFKDMSCVSTQWLGIQRAADSSIKALSNITVP